MCLKFFKKSININKTYITGTIKGSLGGQLGITPVSG